MHDIIDLVFFSVGQVNFSKLTKTKIQKIRDDLFVLETVMLPSGAKFEVSLLVFAKLLKKITEIRKTPLQELKALNQ
ncbi:MAG: hypothetical protein ACFFB3_08825, partial [Candidatus Hodarchaeota archaeon]